jgi:hypothetical protein
MPPLVGFSLSSQACQALLARVERDVVRVRDSPIGAAFVTLPQLLGEIVRCLDAAGGRVATGVLALSLLGCAQHQDAIERAVASHSSRRQLPERVLADLLSTGGLAVCGDDVLSELFVRRAVDEVVAAVHECGFVEIDEWARRLALPAAPVAVLARELCATASPPLVCDVELRAIVLPTTTVRRADAAVRGALLAFDAPVAIDSVAEVARVSRDLALRATERLLKSGDVSGSLDSRAIFTPGVRIRQRDEWIEAFLASNQFVDVDALDALRAGNARVVLGARTDGTLLHSVFVTHQLVERVDASLAVVADEQSFGETSSVLPSFILGRDDDAQQLLALCATQRSGQIVLLREFVVAAGVVGQCRAQLSTMYRQMRRLLARPQRPAFASAPSDIDREAIDALALCNAKLPRELLAALWHERLRSECVELRAQRLRPMSDAEAANQQSRDRDASKQLQTRAVALHCYVQHLRRSHADVAALTDGDRAALEQHLLRTLCSSIISLIVGMQVLAHGVIAIELGEDGEVATMSVMQRDSIVSRLPDEARGPLRALASAASVDAFLSRLALVAEQLGVPIVELDRKREKSLVKSQCQLLREQLAAAVEPGTVLHQATLLLYAVQNRALLHVPADRVPLLIELLRDTAIEAGVLRELELHRDLLARHHESPNDAQLTDELAARAQATRQLVLSRDRALASSTSSTDSQP